MNGETASTLNNESPLVNQIITNTRDLPKNKDHHFWQLIDSLAFKDTALVLLLSSFPKSNPVNMSSETCRAVLAQLWSLRQLLDMPQLMMDAISQSNSPELNPSSDLDNLNTRSDQQFTQD